MKILKTKERPIGVIIIGTVLLLCVFPALCVAFIAGISSGPPDLHIRIPCIFSPVSFLVSGIGVLLFKNWARILTIITTLVTSLVLGYTALRSFTVISSHPEWASSNIPFGIFLLSGVLVFTFIIWYLTRPKVGALFRKFTKKDTGQKN